MTARRRQHTVQEHETSDSLEAAAGINGDCDPVTARRGEDRATPVVRQQSSLCSNCSHNLSGWRTSASDLDTYQAD